VTELCEVVITAPDPDWLLDLTRQLVAEGLCASVHNFSPVRSIYRWQGEVHERTEGRASLHTRMDRVADIVARVKACHPYEVPGISVRPIVGGNPDYLEWMADESAATDHGKDQSKGRTASPGRVFSGWRACDAGPDK
jgi:periplasmic divalent cation tolerance protein